MYLRVCAATVSGMELGDWATWATALFAALALVISYLAHREARANRKSNEKWQEVNAEAAMHSAKAAEQAQTFVEALHAKTEARAEQEARQVRWAIERTAKNVLILRNDSDNTATGVTIDGDQFNGLGRKLPKDATIPGHGSVEFLVISVGERPYEALITWDGQEGPVTIPIPPRW